ncbi:MAG TPA: molybdate ABC transporter substrate-binding protein [Pyrinomonadaceae bacterium]|nr:molybdate ABC transporter substrate-binding protein [Pyrinomonadaceae bacterium]
MVLFPSSGPRKALILALLLLTVSCSSGPRGEPTNELTVAAAADLTNAFEEIGREFQKATGTKVVFNFGSSGMLAKQIEQGAPFDLFAAANIDFVNQLEQKELIVRDTKKVYARGRLVLWTAQNSGIRIEKLSDLTLPEIKRVAIANPEHAPYGMAARQALERAGLWDAVKPKLVYGENIRQAMQYAQTGNVEVAIISLSLTTESDGHWLLVSDELHNPLDQALAVIKGAKNEAAARAFTDFVIGQSGQAIMKRYGFTLPR